MLDAAVEGLKRHGVAGMSFTEVLKASGAARGGIYHHFPGGKTQLVAEAAAINGDQVRARLAALPAGTPHEVVEGFLDAVRPVVVASAAGGGCAVAAVTVSDEAPLRAVADEAFTGWIEALGERLRAAGLATGQAADLATALLALLEGAHVLCRAAGDTAPFERAAQALLALAVDL
jgi:AcrR family transcriptional regulator